MRAAALWAAAAAAARAAGGGPFAPAPSWEDNFSACPGGKPDPAKWGYEIGQPRVKSNNESQTYTANENVDCVGGELVITARSTGGKVTSGSLSTLPTRTFTYGKFEMRGRVDARPGAWPAFWLLGADWNCGDGSNPPEPSLHPGAYCPSPGVVWPSCGEVDIMEYAGVDDMSGTNIYWLGHLWDQGGAVKKSESKGWFAAYHVWSCEWTPLSIEISVDGEVWISAAINSDNAMDAFRGTSVQIILNLAIGGALGGKNIASFPFTYTVDYVKYYPYTGTPAPPPAPTPPPPPACTDGKCNCVHNPSATDEQILAALEWACGNGVDCGPVNKGGACYEPNTLAGHADYTFNAYYRGNPVATSCDFAGAAVLTECISPGSQCMPCQ